MHELAVEAVRCSKRAERVGQLGNPVHALIPQMRLERVGAVALELVAVEGTHPSSSVTGTPRGNVGAPTAGTPWAVLTHGLTNCAHHRLIYSIT
jgi:hypothetical protein